MALALGHPVALGHAVRFAIAPYIFFFDQATSRSYLASWQCIAIEPIAARLSGMLHL